MERLREQSEKIRERIESKIEQDDNNDFGFMQNYKAMQMAKKMYRKAVKANQNLDYIKDVLVHYEMEEDRIVQQIMDSETISFEDIKKRLKDENGTI